MHDWFAFGIWMAVLGHIYFAIRDPVALGGMTRGDVTPYWARTERPAWYREMTVSHEAPSKVSDEHAG